MSEQPGQAQHWSEEQLRAQQNEVWAVYMCPLAIAVNKMWSKIAEKLDVSMDAVHAMTNLAKAAGDNTLSISELAEKGDLTIERATHTIEALEQRGLVVRVLRRPGEDRADRRVQLPADLVGMIVEYYRLQPENYERLGQFTPEQLKFGIRFLQEAAAIADSQATAIDTGQIDPSARLKAALAARG